MACPSRAHAIPVGIHFAKAQAGVERTRGGIIALDLQRGIGSADLLRPGEDLAEQRGRIALLAVLRRCYDIHNAERLGIDNPDRAGDRLIAIPERSKDAWSWNSLQDRGVGVLLLKRLPTELAVERQPVRERLAAQGSRQISGQCPGIEAAVQGQGWISQAVATRIEQTIQGRRRRVADSGETPSADCARHTTARTARSWLSDPGVHG